VLSNLAWLPEVFYVAKPLSVSGKAVIVASENKRSQQLQASLLCNFETKYCSSSNWLLLMFARGAANA